MTAVEPPGELPGSPESLKVDWFELFFDLAFVAVIAQLTGRLHDDPSLGSIASTYAVLGIVWFAWFNEVTLTNVSRGVDTGWRSLILVSMAGVGVMAVGVNELEAGRAPVFAVGYALARIALTPLWVRANWRRGKPIGRPLAFGLGAGLAWLASAFVPTPTLWWLWGGLLAAEAALSVAQPGHQNLLVDGGHMTERLQLFVMIVFGECVALLIAAVDVHLGPDAWVAAAIGFVLLCALFLQYFNLAMDRFQRSIEGVNTRLGDVIGLGPAAVTAGLVGVAAGLGAAVEHAGTGPLPAGSLRVLCGGTIAFSIGLTLLSIDAFRLTLRTRDPLSALPQRRPHQSKAWTVVALAFMVARDVTVPLLVVVFGAGLPVWAVLALVAATPVGTLVLFEVGRRWAPVVGVRPSSGEISPELGGEHQNSRG